MEIPESQKASPCNAMNIDNRKLWIGFICSLLYILLKIMSGLDEYEMALDKTYHTAKQLIFVITNCYLFISILFLLKNVLVDYYHQEKLRTNLVWIIKLNAIIAALSILFVLGLGRYLAAIMVILAIISLIFYLRFFGDIMSMDEHLIPAIPQLQLFVKALLISIGIAAILTVLINYAGKPELKYLNQIIEAIPFIFMGNFFYKTMKTIYE